jgi:2-hydroxymuconate-semialdehyde hydrolase
MQPRCSTRFAGTGSRGPVVISAKKFVMLDGLRTCYYEAGAGPTVVLLHSGEHGACSELSWEWNFHALASEFHVLAFDWLGYGQSAKVHDFVLGPMRRLLQLQRLLEVLCIERAHFVGSSMGATLALRALAQEPTDLPAKSLTLIGAGGNSPDSPARRALIDFDCTFEGMRRVVAALFHDPKWVEDEAYVLRRLELSLEPGAWECAAASRLKNPLTPERVDVGLVDTTPYEQFKLPVLLIAGEADQIKETGYGPKVAARLSEVELHVIPHCGHMPNIECAGQVNELLKTFLRKVEAALRPHDRDARPVAGPSASPSTSRG